MLHQSGKVWSPTGKNLCLPAAHRQRINTHDVFTDIMERRWNSMTMNLLEDIVTPGTVPHLVAGLAVTVLILPRLPLSARPVAAFVLGRVL